ncbi:hypothetical protein HanRHA438_Chr10g0453091 [Helianthus annuus]|uniref:Uncharacterized protein n=1 Tax=Helianthus annuus TaxID=4232 RepID=A0A251TK35_HELAN|nr:uncharacterized protein LOC110885458 [Helianthus annuus]KAF5786449.1 hypothetical protein HanXRQr2_Chr10g0441051 [Helianthus annuus]KAJ0513860.1 hypothetical protein HanHA300_Chr10g0362711 [Helianthus annuus]KAJ0521819.1 hypothetical protein HanIR_Chr10g0475401 [Helianthus annuus]KAJ0529969.1 hypothetical protein HanHA89_Chr10g0384221 [Helianthus annuus]KAJ0696835.1 hypothetical protein HanLR1_Chr10g0361871 [Helianthus annuus]
MEDTESCSNNDVHLTFSDDIDNTVSTPYVSAPSSPGREPPYYGGGFFYSAPASPIHHHTSSCISSTPLEDAGGSFEFELTAEPAPLESMTSADELFLNGQIRPMKLSSHLQHPQEPAPLINIAEHDGDEDRTYGRGRVFQPRDRRRKARSMSPLRSNTAFQWLEEFNDVRECTEINEINEKLTAEDENKQRADNEHENENETTSSGASSRSSSIGRSSKRWIFLKDLLYRSKSEGRNTTNRNRNPRFWSTLSFSPTGKKPSDPATSKTTAAADDTSTAVAEVAPAKTAVKKAVNGVVTKPSDPATCKNAGAADESSTASVKSAVKKAVNGVGMSRKRRGGRSASAHEVHYTRNRAQAEELRKKTYLPYRQGLLGCLGFSSKSYGAMNGFARALNPVSSR